MRREDIADELENHKQIQEKTEENYTEGLKALLVGHINCGSFATLFIQRRKEDETDKPKSFFQRVMDMAKAGIFTQ